MATISGTLCTTIINSVGTTVANIAAVMRRLRPTISASTPANGAVSAIAKVPAVINVEILLGPTSNSPASSGSKACGEYRLTKAEKPAVAMAKDRRSRDMRHYGRGGQRKHPEAGGQ